MSNAMGWYRLIKLEVYMRDDGDLVTGVCLERRMTAELRIAVAKKLNECVGELCQTHLAPQTVRIVLQAEEGKHEDA